MTDLPEYATGNYCSIGAVSDERVVGASSTPAAAARIRTKPTVSWRLGRSPSTSMEANTPTTGALRTPSDAVVAGSRRTISNQSRQANPDPARPAKPQASQGA